ncbi:FtsK/SpoIIIE domain-containing protein [Spirilliplanes yamanashiensis]|uniref:Cell division protein FtsK n=1 Tax=Spirilliplanes yamanashiensis TaxID=42233 RepID=A0A8J3Y4D8_9ACTN|nr:FtsK/SpoIIIE domain-containing protein [Spirilliplanes yamanashiensis]MDP9819899.1 hypothetical protein [Spirilliplanes yamanashiensis]GIJ01282.1 cell division protein FtsK [Spirilliplanes yamanashiensis]
MGSARTALAAVVRKEIATARGTARAVLAAAESARSEAERRRRMVRDAYATCLTQLADARDAARLDILRRYHHESATLSATVETLAAASAPGAAGASWPAWGPTEPKPGRRPGLLRIGMIAYDPPPPPGQPPAQRRALLPALIPLLDHAHLDLSGEQSTVDGVIAGLLLRTLGSTRPGDVRVTVYDPEHLGGTLAAFAPLGSADLLSFVGPGGLGPMLDDLVEQIRRINEQVLAGEYASLPDLTAATAGPRPEPWRVVVLLGDRASGDLPAAQRAQLDRVVRTGVACGVHVVARGVPLAAHPTVEHIVVRDGTASAETTGDLPIRLDPPPPADRISQFCRQTAERLLAGPPPASFADLVPGKLWVESSAHGLVAPVGDGPDGALVDVPLGDDPPHALIGGPSGSGKTNLVYAWLGALATRYDPGELALYLLDFKEGVSFARFAPSPRDPSWLPQVRLAGVNVNGDREFGIALLRHLAGELRRRAQAAKRHDASKLAELRAEDPGGHWPRIVAVIDEFQVLVSGRDAVAAEAVELLEDLARRGRSQGIHLVLASQDVSGIEALWGRSALVAQFTLRIALPKARRILAETNLAADVIPRHHAVVNTDSGVATANRVVRLPDAGDRTMWRHLQTALWEARDPGAEPPRLFDGDAVPVLSPQTLPAVAPGEAALGERIAVDPAPAVVGLGRTPGRNLAVLGGRAAEACDVLAAAALTLATHGPARFTVVCADAAAADAAARLAAALPGAAFTDTVADVPAASDVPHYVVGYALDAAGPGLRPLLDDGPAAGVHVLGWWRSVGSLRESVGGLGARFDAIGSWVALDVHGADLAPLSPIPGGPAWYPRPRRALWFDRTAHRVPEVIIPYEVAL